MRMGWGTLSRVVLIVCMLLAAVWGVSCGGPTGSDDNPVLAVDKTVLDYGEDDDKSRILTISNAGTGTLHFSIEVPSEGWITVSKREGNITNEPLAVDVSIDRQKAPAGQQEVTIVITAEQGGRKEVILKALISRPELGITPAELHFDASSQNKSGMVQTWVAVWPDLLWI